MTQIWTSSFDHPNRSRHLFVAIATENVAIKRERAGFAGRKPQSTDGAGHHLRAQVKIRQIESVMPVLASQLENDGDILHERDFARLEVEHRSRYLDDLFLVRSF